MYLARERPVEPTRERFRKNLKTLTDALVQKRLEHIEGLNPLLASLADLRKEFPDIDQSLLDGLEPDDKA